MKEYKYTINGTKYEVAVGDIEENIVTVTVNGEDFKVEMEKPAEPEKKKPVLGKPTTAAAVSDASPSDNKAAVNKNNAIKAPLPGVITDIKVAVGDEVQVGDTVVVLEAMKMANNLQAEKAGKVTAICVKIGESVMEDDALVVIE
ncbi:MAG: acetyl-CoA carboxylase biotin carboxyl carrier protein subunit [Prevotella sp.]|nr:acetyl-CoA carboxylase biotin carboxyl carrier protein subunit [Prevotella sp.]